MVAKVVGAEALWLVERLSQPCCAIEAEALIVEQIRRVTRQVFAYELLRLRTHRHALGTLTRSTTVLRLLVVVVLIRIRVSTKASDRQAVDER